MLNQFNSLFTGKASYYNPMAATNKVKELLEFYSSNHDFERTKNLYHLTDKQLNVILLINSARPELYLAELFSKPLETFNCFCHSNSISKDREYYQLFDYTLLTEIDFQNLVNSLNRLPDTQIPFSHILRDITDLALTKNTNYKVNYSELTFRISEEHLRLYNQLVVPSEIPSIFYHISSSKNNTLEITRLYENPIQTYQRFRIRI